MKFRKVTAIIRPERLEAVEECLKKLVVPGLSVTKVKGFGEQANFLNRTGYASMFELRFLLVSGRPIKSQQQLWMQLIPGTKEME